MGFKFDILGCRDLPLLKYLLPVFLKVDLVRIGERLVVALLFNA